MVKTRVADYSRGLIVNIQFYMGPTVTISTKIENTSTIDHATSFKLGNNILKKWGCSTAQKQAILGMTKTTFHSYQKDPSKASLTPDQLERLSCLANIHEALSVVFTNPDNTFGFIRMVNNNPFFNGRTPLSMIENGSLGDLYEAYKHIDAMKNGQW